MVPRTEGKRVMLIGVLMLAGAAGAAPRATPPEQAEVAHPLLRAAMGTLPRAQLVKPSGVTLLPTFSAGLVQAARSALMARDGAKRAAAAGVNGPLPAPAPADPAVTALPLLIGESNEGVEPDIGLSRGTLGCGRRNTDGNVRVNQDCGFRGQAEELIKANPVDPDNLIGGMNDGRIGFNHCGFAWTLDGGRTWGDGTPPFWLRLNTDTPIHATSGGPPDVPTGKTYDFASDPSLAFDSAGRTFFGCIVADIFDSANGLLVTEGPAYAKGSFYNTVPPGLFLEGVPDDRFVVTENRNGTIEHDKPFIAADFYEGSPFQDSVYATWTVFKFSASCVSKVNPSGYCYSKIYFSRSHDHAQTWETPREISGVSPVCFFGNFFDPTQSASACDFDSGSDPIVRPNGDIVVVFNNGNTAPNNPNSQQLAVFSTDGGTTWSNPVFVGNDFTVGEPLCDFGRGPEECIPGPYIRTNDFPRIAVNRSNGNLYASWQDYRTGEFDIHLAASFDGGATWHEAAAPVNPDSGRDRRDHYFPAIDVVSRRADGRHQEEDDDWRWRGDHVAVSYFRSDRVRGETFGEFTPDSAGIAKGESDYRLAGGRALATPYAQRRVSPEFPPPDKDFGFNGDYSGLALVGRIAHPIWSDTRNPIPNTRDPNTKQSLHDEDIFTDAVSVPDGRGGGGNDD